MTVTERACALSADAFTTLQQRGGTLPARPAKKAGYLTEHPLTLRLLGYLPQEGELATDAELVTLPLALFSTVLKRARDIQATPLPKSHAALLTQAIKRVRS